MKLKIFLLIAIVLVMSSFHFAAPGELDPTFNGTGIVEQPLPGAGVSDNILAIQADGKILVAGTTGQPAWTGSIIRFNPNGTIDQTFGANGSAYLIYPDGSKRWVAAFDIQPDGKIVIATGDLVSETETCAVTRLNTDGSIDLNFGTMGRATIAVPGAHWSQPVRPCSATNIRSQPDGKVILTGVVRIATGTSTLRDFGVFRFNQDGTPDTGFDNDGYAVADFGNTDDEPYSIAIQPDGKVIVMGRNMQHGVWDHDLVRYNTDGSLDATFGNGGKLVFGDPQRIDGNSAICLQPDGKMIVVGGTAPVNVFFMGMGMLRLNQNGSLDSSFGNNGTVFTMRTVNGSIGAASCAIQPDGKILLGGGIEKYQDSMNGNIAVARYNSDGSLDRAPAFTLGRGESLLSGPYWGTNGISSLSFGGANSYSDLYAMRKDAAGRVVIYGRSWWMASAGTSKIIIARLQGDASPYAGIWGTVRNAAGLPIKNAPVTISGGSLIEPVVVRTGNFGIYQFTGLPVTETYKVSISMKRYQFGTPEQTLMLNGDIANLDFTANQ